MWPKKLNRPLERRMIIQNLMHLTAYYFIRLRPMPATSDSFAGRTAPAAMAKVHSTFERGRPRSCSNLLIRSEKNDTEGATAHEERCYTLSYFASTPPGILKPAPSTCTAEADTLHRAKPAMQAESSRKSKQSSDRQPID